MSTRKKLLTVLVSGAGGFLGHELVSQLLESRNYNIVAMSSKKNLLIDEFKRSPYLKVIDSHNWRSEVEGKLHIDILVNCAFPRTSNPELLAKALLFTEKLIRDSLDLGIKEIINISSQSVYSQKAKELADEIDSVIPESIYGMTKYASERIITALCESSDQKVYFSHIRLGSLCGIGLEARMINRFVKCAIEGKTITINGGNQAVSYLDVRDAGSAIIAMINTDASLWEGTYNLGNHDYCTIHNLAKNVKETAKENGIKHVKVEIQESQDNFNNLINSQLFYSNFKWKPRYSMSLMIKDLFKYYTRQV